MSQVVIHVGYPKAASSYLQAWFEQHPEIVYAPGGVAGFHSDMQMIEAVRSDADISNKWFALSSEHFSIPPSAGDYSPAYYANIREQQATICRLLSAIFPTARIVLVVRGWHDLLQSSYSQYVRTGGTEPMHQLYAAHPEPVASVYDYDYLIGLYERQFGAKTLLVLPYELLRDSEAAFQREIENFLDLSHSHLSVGVHNRTLTEPELLWYPRFSRLFSRLPARLSRKCSKLIFTARLRIPTKILTIITRKKRDKTIADTTLTLLRKQATCLRNRSLFQKYLTHYLAAE